MDRSELKNLIAVGFLIVAVAYVGYKGLGPYPGVAQLRAQAAKLETERRQLQAQIQSAEAMVANLDKIRKDREVLEAQLKDISKRLPTERESEQVLRSVESLAGKSGLTVGQVKRRPVRTQELYAEIPMEVGVGGGYYDLVKFADQLRQLDRLVTLSELQVQRPTAIPGGRPDLTPGTVKASLVTVVFQALPDATPAAGSGPAAAAGAAAPKR